MCILCRSLGSELDALWHSSATAIYDDGATAIDDAPADDTLAIAYATSVSQGPTGNQQVDGLLRGTKWSGTVTYSFPDSPGDYPSFYGTGEPLNGFAQISAAAQQVVNTAMSQIEGFTTLNIQRNDEAGISDGAADIRIAKSADANPTAFGYYPSNAFRGEGGDIWIGTSYGGYNTPVLGNYAYATYIHEIGHALGLKHSHDSAGAGPVPSDRDALEFTVMSYRSYIGGPTSGGYTNEQFGFPQSYMMNDIAALQEMYGADFSLNGTDTVYTWNPTTGEMSINGVGQGAPGANRVFLTIWDGNGIDTYDMSNYTGAVSINLQPGSWSVTSAAQKAYLGNGHYAQGNVYNAYQYNGDARSLIENAVGGSGNDSIIGNAADNTLDGAIGNDSLTGGIGNDALDGGSGNDTLTGDAGDDALDGGIGFNSLTGGTGDDLFVLHAGPGENIIADFTAGGTVDEIYLDSTFIRSFTSVMSAALQVGADTRFFFAGAGAFTLKNAVLGNLTESDFIFSNPAPVSTTAPTDIALSGDAGRIDFSIPENLSIGLSVGYLSVTDPDGETDFTFTLSDNRFEVFHNWGTGTYSLQLKQGIALDNETEPSIDIAVTVTDSGGFSYQEHFIFPVAEGPGATINGTSGNDLVDATHTVGGQPFATEDNDLIYGKDGSDTFYGLGGNDGLEGGAGNDFLYGGEDHDTLIGGAGVDHLEGGDGNDSFFIASSEGLNDTMLGGAGQDRVNVTTADVTLAGFGPANSIEEWVGRGHALLGTSANNVFDFSAVTLIGGLLYVNASGGNDTLTGSMFADDFRGGAGNDILNGGADNDSLNGQGGKDSLNGGGGNDLLAGGKGADTFIFNGDFGVDTITGFTAGAASGHDVIQFDDAQFADFADVLSHATQVGTDVVISLDASHSVTLTSMTLSKLVAADFQFV